MSTEISLNRRRRVSRTRRIAVNALCLVVMLVALGFILPAAFGFSRYVITGSSMAGAYDRGSVVFEQTVPVSELEVGDTITYQPPAESGVTSLVTHRIVSIDGDEFRTKGDANAKVDPWTFKLTGSTQPRVVASVPYAGYAFIALTDRATRIVAIGVPAAIIALLSISELYGADRRRSRRLPGTSPTVGAPPADGPEVPATRTAAADKPSSVRH
ncbi:signal peptidase I [Nocardioides sp. LHG3406-4]|uniref:signal peptidase I n=1 Tax=Nocardioides sp. LHG3406-4 TaxID=2804575 RepID=UPI003CF18292